MLHLLKHVSFSGKLQQTFFFFQSTFSTFAVVYKQVGLFHVNEWLLQFSSIQSNHEVFVVAPSL